MSKKLLGARVREEHVHRVNKIAKQRNMTKAELVEELVETGLGIDDPLESVNNEIEELTQEREELEQTIKECWSTLNDAQDRIDEIEERLPALKKKQGQLTDRENRYEQQLDDLLEEMEREGSSVYLQHGKVQDIAAMHDKDAEAVIDELKEQTDLPSERFEEGGGNEPEKSPTLASTGGGA